MKCNYDGWKTPVIKSINDKMADCIRLMRDGKERTRAEMLRANGIDPNPKSAMGYPGNERTDYYLYKKGLISVVRMQGEQKVFRITQAGRTVALPTAGE